MEEHVKTNGIKSFDIEQHEKCDKIIIYGASAYGEIAYQALIQNEITPAYFCDRKALVGVGGIPVIKPEQVDDYQDAAFIIASADSFQEIKNYLWTHGCKKIFDMRLLLESTIDISRLSNRARDVYDNRNNYFDAVNRADDGAIYFSRLQYVVSERCSLRCRNCSHLMQYYKHPQDVDLDEYKPAFDRFLDAVDQISEIRIMGGEPFMNQEVYKLIEWYYGHPKVNQISIYTNGTITPSENNLKSLAQKNIRLHISDYGINKERIPKVTERLDEYGIAYFVRRYDSWQDAGNLKDRGYSEKAMQQSFAACFERNSYTFFRGKLYHCARSAHGMHLGAIPWEESDVVDFTIENKTTNDFRTAILQLQEKKYLRACDYCNGPNFHEGNIPAGEQIDRPLDF